MSTFSGDAHNLKALGHGALGLVNGAILVAIIAVVLAQGSTAVAALQQAFQFLAWLVRNTVAPITGGSSVQLGSTYEAAGGFPSVPSGSGGVSYGPPSSGLLGGSQGGMGGLSYGPGTGVGPNVPIQAPSGQGPEYYGTNPATGQFFQSQTFPGFGGAWGGYDPQGNLLGTTSDPVGAPIPGATSYGLGGGVGGTGGGPGVDAQGAGGYGY